MEGNMPIEPQINGERARRTVLEASPAPVQQLSADCVTEDKVRGRIGKG